MLLYIFQSEKTNHSFKVTCREQNYYSISNVLLSNQSFTQGARAPGSSSEDASPFREREKEWEISKCNQFYNL
jgi:hypothetical protein